MPTFFCTCIINSVLHILQTNPLLLPLFTFNFVMWCFYVQARCGFSGATTRWGGTAREEYNYKLALLKEHVG